MQQKDMASDFIIDRASEKWYQTSLETAAECVRILYAENPETAFPYVVKQLCTALSARSGFLYQIWGTEWRLTCEWSLEQPVASAESDSLPEIQFTGWEEPAPLLLKTLEPLQEICRSFYALLCSKGVSSAAVIPLESGGTIIGCIGVDQPDPSTFDSSVPLLKILGSTLTAAQNMHKNHLELERLRLYDGLTGIFHRGIYLRELQAERPEQESLGIIRLQIIDIKRMNACYGYANGDELLVKCIRQAAKLVDKMGSLYRVGCDEFAIICTGLEREPFEALANRLSPDLEQALNCAAAVGYQWTPQPRNVHRLDLAAESMMEKDKQRYVRLQALTGRQRVVGEDIYGMLTLDGVTSLLAAERFIVYLQPKLSFSSGTLVGAEALVRFFDSSDSIVEPGRFLPDLEAAMLIKYVDLYVFEQACKLIRSWVADKYYKSTAISVNFSKMTLMEPNLVAKMLHLCHKYEVSPNCLEVEITGGQDKQQSEDLSKTVDKIKAAGFVVSVDDFGIRFANLSLLIALDCDKLKLDRSLIENITTSQKAQSVLKALSALCTATGTKTTVEGIETEEQLALLKGMGFDEMQGYLISQPLSVSEFKNKYLC